MGLWVETTLVFIAGSKVMTLAPVPPVDRKDIYWALPREIPNSMFVLKTVSFFHPLTLVSVVLTCLFPEAGGCVSFPHGSLLPLTKTFKPVHFPLPTQHRRETEGGAEDSLSPCDVLLSGYP